VRIDIGVDGWCFFGWKHRWYCLRGLGRVSLVYLVSVGTGHFRYVDLRGVEPMQLVLNYVFLLARHHQTHPTEMRLLHFPLMGIHLLLNAESVS